nr:ATPase GET3, Arsenical pump-driving ATPase [Seculamonas ecuadoriensis]
MSTASDEFFDAESRPDPTLTNLLTHTSLRWIFVGGKGGVGKTTVSCSLAVQLARVRESVLLISTDPAHNVSDAFGQQFCGEPTRVQGFANLYAMEVDPKQLDEEAPGAPPGMSMLNNLQQSLPGIDEMMSFQQLMRQVQSFTYSCVVFDTAPTGHTLRLLSFPSEALGGFGQLFRSQSLQPVFTQMASMFFGSSETPDSVMRTFGEGETLMNKISEQFKDPDRTTFVAVCIPEFLSLFETERLIQELMKNEIDCHNVVVNQLLYKEPGDTSRILDARMRIQRKYLTQIDQLYEDFHVVKVPLALDEVRGVERLTAFGQNLVAEAPELRYLAPAEESSAATE